MQQKWHILLIWVTSVTSFLFPVSVSSSLYFSTAVCFPNFFRFWIVCQETSVWALFCRTHRLLFSSWQQLNWRFTVFSLQMVKCCSVLSQHNTLSISLCLYPAFSSFVSSLISPLASFSLSSLSLIHIPFFLHLPFFIIACCLFLTLFSFLNFSSSLTPVLYRLPLSSYSPPVSHSLSSPLLWSFPSSLHLPIISLSLPSHTLLQSPPHPLSLSLSLSLSLHLLFPLRLSLLGTLYLLSLCLLPLQRWGRREGEKQPFGGFSSQLTRCGLSLNLKMLCWKIDCFRGFLSFHLFKFILYRAPTPACYVKQSSLDL